MSNWLPGPLNDSLCAVYTDRMLMVILPEGLVIGALRCLRYNRVEKKYALVTRERRPDEKWLDPARVLAYKMMDP